MKIIGNRGLGNNVGKVVVLTRGSKTMEGLLMFGDIRDKGIVADYSLPKKNEIPYLFAANLRWVGRHLLPSGMCHVGTKSRQYEGWNVSFKTGDLLTLFTSDLREVNYKITLPE